MLSVIPMGCSYDTHGRDENAYNILVQKSEEKTPPDEG
jgi:hypothetical protein